MPGKQYHELARQVLEKSQCLDATNAVVWMGHALVSHHAAKACVMADPQVISALTGIKCRTRIHLKQKPLLLSHCVCFCCFEHTITRCFHIFLLFKAAFKEVQRRQAALQCAIEVPPPPATPSPALLGLGFAMLTSGQFSEACVPLRQLIDRFEGEYPRSHHHPHLPAIAHALLSLAMGMGRDALLHEALEHAREAEKLLKNSKSSLPKVQIHVVCG